MPSEQTTLEPEIIMVDADDYDEMVIALTGAATLEDAERAIAMGPEAWAVEQEACKNAR